MATVVRSFAIQGIDGHPVDIEVKMLEGQPVDIDHRAWGSGCKRSCREDPGGD